MNICFKSDIPRAAARRALDVFRYLRDALDHALYSSAVAIKGGDPNRCKFPFGDTPNDVEREIVERRCCDDVHPNIVKLIIASRPYETGNRPLWAMNKVRNTNTHRAVLPAVASGPGIIIRSGRGQKFDVNIVSEWRSTRRELVWARFATSADANFKVEPIIDLSLNPAFGFGRRRAAEVFQQAFAISSALVSDITDETARILAARNA